MQASSRHEEGKPKIKREPYKVEIDEDVPHLARRDQEKDPAYGSLFTRNLSTKSKERGSATFASATRRTKGDSTAVETTHDLRL